MELTEQRAILTGASRGIGRALAAMLARNGVRVLAVGRDEIALENLREELGVVPLCADLADPAQVRALPERAAALWGGVDILINNAGIGEPAPLAQTPLEMWEQHMAINARAPFLLCQAALPYLAQSHGTIVNISSVVGHRAYANQGAYSASKHALVGLTEALAQEVQPLGIRVHLISPGGVNTAMVARTRPDLAPEDLAQPEEIADIVEFLLTHRCNAVIDEIRVRRHANKPFQ